MIAALRSIVDDLTLAFGSLVYTAQDPQQLKDLLADLGWKVNSVPQPLLDLAVAGSDLLDLIETDAEETSLTDMIDAIKRLVDGINAIRTKPDSAFPSEIDVASFKATIGRDLLDYVIVEHLLRNRYKIGDVLKLAGLIRLVEIPGTGLRQPYIRRQVMWNRIGELITDPAKGFRESFDWNSPTPQLAQALSDFASLLESYGLQAVYFKSEGDQLAFVNAGATEPFDESIGINLAFKDSLDPPIETEAGVQLLLRPATSDRKAAISFLPYAHLNALQEIQLNDTVSLSFHGDVDFTKGVAITLAPEHAPEVQAGFLGGTATGPAKVQIGLKVTPLSDEPERVLIGTSDASRLAIKSLTLSAGTRLVSFDELDAFVALTLENAHVVIKSAAGETDSFIASFLGPDGISAQVSFELRVSSLTGFHFVGSGGLDVSLPIHNTKGPINFQALSIGFKPGAQGADLEVGARFAGKLGPLTAIVDRVGFQLVAKFPDPPTGNLGPVDLGVSFKPPSAIGLVIDASIVKGGGFLSIDEDRGEYFGVMELTVGSIGIKAIVILSTKMPDGTPGWSLLMLIYSEFPPIQLSWGFTLNRVGGMIAVQHGMQIEELKTGMRTGALDDILFPSNPVVDAPRIINRLRVIFPATPRALVVGPMLELGWSTPAIMKIRMGLLFQIDNVFGGDRPASIKRIILLGQLLIELPPEVDEKEVLLRLLVDFYGYYDFDMNRLEFAARLRDSHVMKLPLGGMLFLRAEFGAKPTFILSAGGFHPNFKDLPADIPSPIDRLEINFKIDYVQIRAQKYFAVTPASVQTGASIEVNASVGPVDISGWLGYDAIFYFKPRFFFEVDIRAGILVKYRGHKLAGVTLKLHLEGPGKWRAIGSVTFSIFWWDIEKSFDASWGKDPELPEVRTNVALLMEKEFADTRNWRAQLPQGGESVVTLAIAADEDAVLAHPLGQLQVSQRVAPLDLELQHFGNTEVDGARQFSVTGLTVSDNQIENREPALEFFARSHFVSMSEEEKLTSPSFEKFSSGITVGSDDFLTSPDVIDAELQFETKYIIYTNSGVRIIDAETDEQKLPLGISPTALLAQMQHGAAAKSAMRRTAPLRPGPRKIKLSEPGLKVTSTDTQASAVDLQGLTRATFALAEQEARKFLGKNSLGFSHTVLEEYELIQ